MSPTLDDALDAAADTWVETGVPPLTEWIAPARNLRGQIDIIRALFLPNASVGDIRQMIEDRLNARS